MVGAGDGTLDYHGTSNSPMMEIRSFHIFPVAVWQELHLRPRGSTVQCWPKVWIIIANKLAKMSNTTYGVAPCSHYKYLYIFFGASTPYGGWKKSCTGWLIGGAKDFAMAHPRRMAAGNWKPKKPRGEPRDDFSDCGAPRDSKRFIAQMVAVPSGKYANSFQRIQVST